MVLNLLTLNPSTVHTAVPLMSHVIMFRIKMTTVGVMTNSHRLFLQRMMSHGCLGSQAVKLAWKEACDRYEGKTSLQLMIVLFIPLLSCIAGFTL